MKRVVRALEAESIPYLITGSIASSMQGEPRSTHDLDVVVDLDWPAAQRLSSHFASTDVYLSLDAVRAAILARKQFNLIDGASGDKVDFWLHARTPFDDSRFARRQRQSYIGTPVNVSSPEDTILRKLAWMRECGGSEKQFGDCRGVYEVQFEVLDQAYMDRWARELGIEDLLARLRAESQPI